ncbi:type I-A CRISPR-associated protein Cas7/Csa2 [Ignicoccus hospitalis]|uniref:CRISPR-associated autoregulator, DevR family n=1 Tax=Ignicoccus hospitalis (strain KIN4/I / DSM 18386 / JCM 14125) TaxID=453591 RepID=A8ABL5_IGNH4|nr:type I-A CRISPR-associated protein Cas7/Csa2 [Ignicoccus hospitalis]ABU82317.1 CRISPR-associated autoregulator, DevR family [Ignicoccus hospitalis KIN4/I]HIH89829.1 type I-A CRISPR-associated protein Cas7/Csa2 [Desulfurococcaceae archaeon]
MFVGLSVSGRILLNAEALNMAESVGNVTRHRKAPVVLKTNQGFRVVYVPAISGESLAHAYQSHLADVAKEMGLPVCKCCEQKVFIKSNDSKMATQCGHSIDVKAKNVSQIDIERKIVEECVVEDVGGFLFTDKAVKRTSRFRVGYMLPTLDSLREGAFGSEPEIHVRFAGAQQEEGQILYYVEVGSALYNFNFSLDVSEIGKLSSENADLGKAPGELPAEERLRRAEAAVVALKRFLGTMLFGAKRTRFNPVWDVYSLQAVVTTLPFEATPGNDKDYVKDTVERLCSLGVKAWVFYFDKEDKKDKEDKEGVEELKGCDAVSVEKVGSYLEAVSKAGEKALELLKGAK